VYPLWSLPGDLQNADVAKRFSSSKKRGLSGEERFIENDNRPKPTWTVSQCVSWTKRREILGSSLAFHSNQSYLPLPWCKHSPHRGRYLTHYTPDHQLYCPYRQHKALSIWRTLLPRMDRFNRDNRKLKQPRRRQQRKREKRSRTTALDVHHTFSCKFLRRPPHDFDVKLSIKCEVL